MYGSFDMFIGWNQSYVIMSKEGLTPKCVNLLIFGSKVKTYSVKRTITKILPVEMCQLLDSCVDLFDSEALYLYV